MSKKKFDKKEPELLEIDRLLQDSFKELNESNVNVIKENITSLEREIAARKILKNTNTINNEQ